MLVVTSSNPQKSKLHSSSSSCSCSSSSSVAQPTLIFFLIIGRKIQANHDPGFKHSSRQKLQRAKSLEASKVNLSEEKHGGAPRIVHKCQRKSLTPLRLDVQVETSFIFYIPVLHFLPRTKMLTRSKSLH